MYTLFFHPSLKPIFNTKYSKFNLYEPVKKDVVTPLKTGLTGRYLRSRIYNKYDYISLFNL